METTRLGRSELSVSRIAFGTWSFGGDWGEVDTDGAVAAIRLARELGVTFFDTAQGYGHGAAEAILGDALRADLDARRDQVVIATKGGIDPDAERTRDSGREFLRSGVESSLRAMKIDYIDLYQVHWPDPQTPFADTAGYLQELVDEGKIRHVGVSNFDAAQMAEFATVRPVETLQPPYHLFRRGVEAETWPYVQANDIGVLTYSPLGSGLLTGAMTEDTTFDEDDWRAQASAFTGEGFRTNLRIVGELTEFAASKGVEVSQLAIAWVLAQPEVDVAIIGARSRRNVERSVAAADITLDAADLAEIDRITMDGYEVSGATPEGAE